MVAADVFPRQSRAIFIFNDLKVELESGYSATMRKALARQITTCFFCQGLIIITAFSVSVWNAHEVKSSYYLISTQVAEKCVLTKVKNIFDEDGCLSVCNKDDRCIAAVYNTGSCLLKLNPKHSMNGKAVEISKGENMALFKKVSHLI